MGSCGSDPWGEDSIDDGPANGSESESRNDKVASDRYYFDRMDELAEGILNSLNLSPAFASDADVPDVQVERAYRLARTMMERGIFRTEAGTAGERASHPEGQRLLHYQGGRMKPWQCADCLGRAHGRLRDGTALCYTCGGKRADRIRDILKEEGIRKQPYGDAWHCIWGHPNKWPEGIPPSMIADEAELPKSRVLELIRASAPKEKP